MSDHKFAYLSPGTICFSILEFLVIIKENVFFAYLLIS